MYTALVSRSGCKPLDNGESALLPSKYETFLPFYNLHFFPRLQAHVMALHLETIKKKVIIVWILMAVLQENTMHYLYMVCSQPQNRKAVHIVYNL